MSVETVARRYASALADVVVKSGETQHRTNRIKNVGTNDDLPKSITGSFRNPSIAHLNKEKVLETLLERSKPNKTTANFLRVLLRNNRLTELGQINERFASVISERSGETSRPRRVGASARRRRKIGNSNGSRKIDGQKSQYQIRNRRKYYRRSHHDHRFDRLRRLCQNAIRKS